jgi:hypothetical protein
MPNQTNPNFSLGGNVFGRIAAQWNQYFSAKVDAEGGTADNLALTGVTTAETINAASIEVGGLPVITSVDENFVVVSNELSLAPIPSSNFLGVSGTGAAAEPGPVPFSAILADALSNAQGFTNRLRGHTMSCWTGGTALTIGTAGGWANDGIYVVPSGASITASRITNPLPLTLFALQLNGSAGNTGVKLRFVVESYDANPLLAQQCLFQVPVINLTAGTKTVTLTTKYPQTAQDDWSAANTDVGPVSLKPLPSGSGAVLAYCFPVNGSAIKGYEVILDFGALAAGSAIIISGGFDLRATPGGFVTGIVPSGTGATVAGPPVPEIRTGVDDILWCQRFREASYSNGTALGTATQNGESLWTAQATITGVTLTWQGEFKVAKRVQPIPGNFTFYSPLTGASGVIRSTGGAGADVAALAASPGASRFGIQTNGSIGALAVGNNLLAHWLCDVSLTGAPGIFLAVATGLSRALSALLSTGPSI